MKSMMMIAAVILMANFSYADTSVDLATSTVGWVGKKKIGDKHTGTVKLKEAKIGKDGLTGEFAIDLSTIVVGDLEGEWKTKFEGHIKSADFFDVEKYPTAKLVIEKVKDGKASGQLTIKDKTQPVTIDFKQSGKTYSGKLELDRTKFGLVYGSENFFKKLTADKIIQDKFEINFNLVTK